MMHIRNWGVAQCTARGEAAGDAGSSGHLLRDDADFAHHLNYLHWNPVKHGLVTRAGDWQQSSFHR